MRPCKKIVTNPYAARYLRRAQKLAASLRKSTGRKLEFIDGCIIEGRRNGGNTTASVIEPTGRILLVADNYVMNSVYARDRLDSDSIPAGTREPYHPTEVSNELPPFPGAGGFFPMYKRRTYYPYYVGRPMYNDEDQSVDLVRGLKAPQYWSTSPEFIYRSRYMHDRTATSQRYLQIIADKASSGLGGSFDGQIVYIHQDEVNAFGNGYRVDTLPYYARRSKVVEVEPGKLVLVANLGMIVEEFPPDEGAPPGSIGMYDKLYREKLIRIDIDLRLEENAEIKKSKGAKYNWLEDTVPPLITGYLFPDSLIPTDLLPGEVLRPEKDGSGGIINVPMQAKTAMTLFDLELTEDGNILAAIKYQVKKQYGDEPLHPHSGYSRGTDGITVIAYGLASWGGPGAYFDIVEREVIDPSISSPLIPQNGADPEVFYADSSVRILDGKFVRSAAVLKRGVLSMAASNDNVFYEFLPPYFVEIINGVKTPRAITDPFLGIAYGGRGLTYDPGFAVDFERDFYEHSNWVRDIVNGAKVKVSDTAYALPASGGLDVLAQWFIRSSSQGLMFVDGEKRRYEEISGFPEDVESQYITVTCHQREVRDDEGVLITPCVLVVGAIINGERVMCVRKGPIWEEDFTVGYSFEDFWKVVPAINNAYISHFYIGNSLMSCKHGEFFTRKKEVTP